MFWLTKLGRLFVPQPDDFRTLQSEFAGFEEQLAAIRNAQAQPRPWRPSSVQEALGVPAILSAVSLISGTVGSLSMEAFRNGALVTDSGQVPRLIVRPNPKSTPREFWLRTAFYMATRGEFWWWVAHRDTDGNPDALYPVPPWEITVEQNDRDRTRPVIRWLNEVKRNEDMRHQVYLPASDGLRGVGPLQLAGAAVSVTVEASNWAANFFSGGFPSLIGTTLQDYDEIDLKALDKQWSEKPNNLPRWMTNGLTLSETPFDAQKAQLTESRGFQVGEVARMFGIPGPLLEYQMSGQSLTYRNEADIWTDFQRRALSPHYLEPIEQEMSDQLTRSTVGRFNLEQLLRADVKTRAEAYNLMVPLGIITAPEARQKEGYEPGSVDFAPVPFAPPQADPGAIPMQLSASPVRCAKCATLLAEFATPPYRFTCRKCKQVTTAEALKHEDPMLAVLANREPPQVTVHPANVTFEAGAIAAPDMSGIVQAIRELAGRTEAPMFGEGAIQVAAPDMTGVAEALVAVADRPQPDITVHLPGPTSKRIERDEDGHLIRIVEEPA